MVRLSLGLVLITLLCFCAHAQSIIIEAESYVAHHDEGGNDIYVTSCSGASGGEVVEGFDYVGDWIEMILNVPDNASFADSLRSGGLLNAQSELQSTVFGAGPLGEDLVSAFYTVGQGIG